MFRGCVCSQDAERTSFTDWIMKKKRHEIKQRFKSGPTEFLSDALHLSHWLCNISQPFTTPVDIQQCHHNNQLWSGIKSLGALYWCRNLFETCSGKEQTLVYGNYLFIRTGRFFLFNASRKQCAFWYAKFCKPLLQSGNVDITSTKK